MKKWESEIFKNNNIKLMIFNIILSFIYLIPLALFGFTEHQKVSSSSLLTLAICVILSGTHIMLAYGSKHKIEASRKASEILGVILMLGFPIGTVIGYLFLQHTLWRDPEKYEVQSPS